MTRSCVPGSGCGLGCGCCGRGCGCGFRARDGGCLGSAERSSHIHAAAHYKLRRESSQSSSQTQTSAPGSFCFWNSFSVVESVCSQQGGSLSAQLPLRPDGLPASPRRQSARGGAGELGCELRACGTAWRGGLMWSHLPQSGSPRLAGLQALGCGELTSTVWGVRGVEEVVGCTTGERRLLAGLLPKLSTRVAVSIAVRLTVRTVVSQQNKS